MRWGCLRPPLATASLCRRSRPLRPCLIAVAGHESLRVSRVCVCWPYPGPGFDEDLDRRVVVQRLRCPTGPDEFVEMRKPFRARSGILSLSLYFLASSSSITRSGITMRTACWWMVSRPVHAVGELVVEQHVRIQDSDMSRRAACPVQASLQVITQAFETCDLRLISASMTATARAMFEVSRRSPSTRTCTELRARRCRGQVRQLHLGHFDPLGVVHFASYHAAVVCPGVGAFSGDAAAEVFRSVDASRQGIDCLAGVHAIHQVEPEGSSHRLHGTAVSRLVALRSADTWQSMGEVEGSPGVKPASHRRPRAAHGPVGGNFAARP